jgi:hypothetical protein
MPHTISGGGGGALRLIASCSTAATELEQRLPANASCCDGLRESVTCMYVPVLSAAHRWPNSRLPPLCHPVALRALSPPVRPDAEQRGGSCTCLQAGQQTAKGRPRTHHTPHTTHHTSAKNSTCAELSCRCQLTRGGQTAPTDPGTLSLRDSGSQGRRPCCQFLCEAVAEGRRGERQTDR